MRTITRLNCAMSKLQMKNGGYSDWMGIIFNVLERML